jgi:hypothetical protein
MAAMAMDGQMKKKDMFVNRDKNENIKIKQG